MRALSMFLVVMTLATTTMASQPGEPLDCSDWVFMEPGLSCSVKIPVGCQMIDPVTSGEPPFCSGGNGIAQSQPIVINNGEMILARDVPQKDATGSPVKCRTTTLDEVQLVRAEPDGDGTVIAYVRDRCIDPTNNLADILGLRRQLSFDAVSGSILVGLLDYCAGVGCDDRVPHDTATGLYELLP